MRFPAAVDALMAVVEACEQEGRGRVAFLAGSPGSGRGAVLDQLERALEARNPRPHLLRGSTTTGRYVPVSGRTEPNRDGLDVVSDAVTLAAPLLGALGALAGQLVGVSAAAKRLADDVRSRHVSPPQLDRFLLGLLREAARERPVVVLVDHVDEAEADWWSRLLDSWANELDAGLPIMLVVTLEGPAELGEHQKDEPFGLFAARELVDAGLATWTHLGPLDQRETTDWLEVDGVVARRLLQASNGGGAVVLELFEAWVHAGAIRRRAGGGQWQLVDESEALPSVKDVVVQRVADRVGTDARMVHLTFVLLAHCALEGETFTADAIAEVVARDRDEVVNLLDDKFAGDEDGLIRELPLLTVRRRHGAQAHLCRYRFTDRFSWLALEQPRRDGAGREKGRNAV